MVLQIVKCYMSDCDREVIGQIVPKRNPNKTPLLVCKYHLDILSEIYIESEYEEGSGWFTMLDQKVNSDAKVKGFFPVG